jgi:hypothetical protein
MTATKGIFDDALLSLTKNEAVSLLGVFLSASLFAPIISLLSHYVVGYVISLCLRRKGEHLMSEG